jgi:hypothetical protein
MAAKTKRPGYELKPNGELWTTGEHAYMCGYVMNPENLDEAIENHEEEMRSLMAEARAEFGL